jgi:hypothetical protein
MRVAAHPSTLRPKHYKHIEYEREMLQFTFYRVGHWPPI